MKEIYDALMRLVGMDALAFFFREEVTHAGTRVRIFNYHHALYQHWLEPYARESRGIMFAMNENNEPTEILAWPQGKFFNYRENPSTQNLDLTQIAYVMDKADGSLISTFIDKDDNLYCKSRGSTCSEQAMTATNLLTTDKRYSRLLAAIMARPDYTFNLELVGPFNQIVLYYNETRLIVHSARNRITGVEADIADLFADIDIRPHMIATFEAPEDPYKWVEEARRMEDIEGFVVRMKDGSLFKLKTVWHYNKFQTKYMITENNETLFTEIANGGSDDMKSLHANDAEVLRRIEAFEKVFFDTLREDLEFVLNFRKQFSGYNRPDYVVAATIGIHKRKPELFDVLMRQYEVLDPDAALNQIEQLFLRNYQKYVPVEYRRGGTNG